MRQTSARTQSVWAAGDYSGPNRPIVRATIQRLNVRLRTYGTQTYSSIFHGQARPIELPNVRSVKWSRSIDGVATMTMTLWNTAPLPLGQAPTDSNDFDLPGYYTPNRGKAFGAPPWNHAKNAWQDWIVPDRIIRTYEGYGFDGTKIPELDENLYQSGTWLVDDVTFAGGLITIEARDAGRALLDQVLMPPIVPMANYPLYFEQYHDVKNPDIVETVGGWTRPRYDMDVNSVHGFSSMFGHTGADAFDGKDATYWLSISYYAPADPYSFGFIQGKVPKGPLSAVKFKTWAGPYTAYISVMSNGKWQGSRIVPYDPKNSSSLPNGANIPYVKSVKAKKDAYTTVSFDTPYENVTKVRIAFTNLYDTGKSNPYRHRMGLRDFQVSTAVTVTRDGGTHVEPFTAPPGLTDYSDIVKHLLAWAGWHWPQEAAAAFETLSNGAKIVNAAPSKDAALASGRVWGDIERCGTAGVAPLGVQLWDKKPVMDGIRYVADLLGYIFLVGEDGAAIFRSPNIWSIGNWVGNGSAAAGRTGTVLELSDDKVLLNLSAKLSSRSIRERVFVGNLAGQVAGMSPGYNPYPSGLRRVGGYTDEHFQTEAECRVMADLIALRQLFTYRTDSVTIPGNPAIQIDDQVRLYERVSEESYLHYVKDISMEWDAKTGKYTYTLGTHWLGDHPFDRWTFDPADLHQETQDYLKAMGRWAP